MAMHHKIADVPITCLGNCGNTAKASIWQTEAPGIIGALPPEGWLIRSGEGTVFAFCCVSCAERLHLRCAGNCCENREQRRARKRQQH